MKVLDDVLITEGFPKGWFIQDRRGEGVAILCGPTMQWPGSVAVCLRPKAMETSEWLSTARAIAAALQQAGVEVAVKAVDRPAEIKAFSDWAWMKDGEAIGNLSPSQAAREAWLARAALAHVQQAGVESAIAARVDIQEAVDKEVAQLEMALPAAVESELGAQCDGQLCYYHGCQGLPGCIFKPQEKTDGTKAP